MVVLGAGTAGLTTALALARKASLRIAVVDVPEPSPLSAVEVLSDEARPALESLKLWRPFLAEHHLRALARRAGRVAPSIQAYDLAPKTFIYDPDASGWTVERRWFDAMLAREATRLGVVVQSETKLLDAARTGPPTLLLSETFFGPRPGASPTEGRVAQRRNVHWGARFVVDASGAPARYACLRGAKHDVQDRLTGVTVRFASHAPSSPANVEPWSHGWWCSDQRPNGQLLVSCMTDPDTVSPLGLTGLERWWAHLDQTHVIRHQVNNAWAESTPIAHSASSHRLKPIVGADWLAVDEAACTLHPLATAGMLRAVTGGIRAAHAIHRHLEGGEGLGPYAHRIASEYNLCLRAVASYYAAEQIRWSGRTFWQQRRALV